MKAVMNEQKKAEVKELITLLDNSDIVGVLDMESLPAKNLGAMRKQLRSSMTMLMRKKRLIKLALAGCKNQELKVLEEYLTGMPALLFTKDNPFKLFKTIKKNQSSAPIKVGQVAPSDLIVPAGVTEFTPGPMIGELGQMGIKTAVEDGKIAIKADATIAKEGDVIDEKQAGFLAKMGVEPMRIGLKIVAIFENGNILTGKVLDIDEDVFMANLQGCAAEARTLAIELVYASQDTIEALLSKAHMQAGALADEANILTSDNVGQVLAKASAAGEAISALVPDAPVEEKKEAPTEEKPAETPEATESSEKKEATKDEEPAKETPKDPTKEEKPVEEPAKEKPVEEPKVEVPAEESKETPKEEVKEEPSESKEEVPAPESLEKVEEAVEEVKEETVEAPDEPEKVETPVEEPKEENNDQPAKPGNDTKEA